MLVYVITDGNDIYGVFDNKILAKKCKIDIIEYYDNIGWAMQICKSDITIKVFRMNEFELD